VRRAGVLESGQWLAMIGASGGGYGDPRARDRALVEKDLREDRISYEAAVDIYGLDPEVAASIRPPA
jgi:N-methylhydantoinase B